MATKEEKRQWNEKHYRKSPRRKGREGQHEALDETLKDASLPKGRRGSSPYRGDSRKSSRESLGRYTGRGGSGYLRVDKRPRIFIDGDGGLIIIP